ncbi:MAG TPA: acyltransferase [Euzebyales bacterium]
MRALLAPAAQIAAATPPDRDRYLDLLRGLSIAVVVIGHWLLPVLWLDGGQLRVDTLLTAVPGVGWVTWIVQVMPLFFLVGGVVNVRSWRVTRANAGSYATWVARRAARLLRPTIVLVWTWVVLAAAALAMGVDRSLVLLGARNALVPLWFLAVYLLMIAALPLLLAAYTRWGLAVIPLLLAAAGLVDAATVAGVPVVEFVNYPLVWAVPTVLGFAWADGRLEGRAVRLGLPTGALACLVAAVTVLGYPITLVGVADAGGPRVPVTLALLGLAQAGIALAVRRPVAAWLERPGPWAAVVRTNTVAMTVYLWHLTVMVLVAGALTAVATWWAVDPLSAAWWLTRPLWLVGLAAALVPVVAVLLPIEHSVPPVTPRPRGRRTVAATVVTVLVASLATAVVTAGGTLGLSGVAAAIVLTAAARLAGAFGPAAVVAS